MAMREEFLRDEVISDRALMELALHAAIQLERARINKSADIRPVEQLARALERASSVSGIEAAGQPHSLAHSSVLEPFERMLLFERARGNPESIGNYLELASKHFLQIISLDPVPEDIEKLIDFCLGLHRVLRSYARADREKMHHGRRRYLASVKVSRSSIKNQVVPAPG